MPAAARQSAPALTPMPEALEVRYALSALPPALRDAGVKVGLSRRTAQLLAAQGAAGADLLFAPAGKTRFFGSKRLQADRYASAALDLSLTLEPTP